MPTFPKHRFCLRSPSAWTKNTDAVAASPPALASLIFGTSITPTRVSFKRRGLVAARTSGIMTHCTRSVCFASNARLIVVGRVSCGAGLRVGAVSSAQPDGRLTRIKMAISERHLIVSLQVTPMVNRSSDVAQESRQLKSLSIEKSPLDSDVIAIPKRPETIHIRSLSVGRKRNDEPLF